MTTANDTHTEPYPPAPGRLIERFAAKLAEFPRGQMAPSDNPAYVALLAREHLQTITRILDEARDYVKHGHDSARDVAKCYRTSYAIFHAIDTLHSHKKHDDLSHLLQLGLVAGMDEPTLRSTLSPQADTPEKQEALAQVPADELRAHLLEQQLAKHPTLTNALRIGAHEFDKQMMQRGLYGFRDMFRTSPGRQAQRAINVAQRSAIGTLGGGTALAWLGWISPEFAIGSALLGTAMSSGVWLINQNTTLNEGQIVQLGEGLNKLSTIVADLERATDEREAAEAAAKQPKRASR